MNPTIQHIAAPVHAMFRAYVGWLILGIVMATTALSLILFAPLIEVSEDESVYEPLSD